MLLDTTIPAARAWNSWSDRPAEMVFLPLGVRLTPVLYATSLRNATTIRATPADGTRLGAHAADGALVELTTRHGGTELAFSYRKPDPYVVVGSWRGVTLGEWGLRFWVSLCLSAEGGETVAFDAAAGAAVVKVGRRWVALVSAAAPVQVTAHDDIAALIADFEANGYFYTATRGTDAPVIAQRFNLEMMRDNRFAAAVADDRDLAVAKAKAALSASDLSVPLPGQRGRFDGCLDAVRDVMAWNTVWDGVNNRAYTAVSRIWNLGKFAVWFNDTTYAAMMGGVIDGALAADNLATAMASATPQGNFACIVTSNDAWVDRTQAPNGALMVWLMYLRSRDRSLLDAAYGPLARNQRWWRANRDPDGRGLVSCGSSDVGEALYKGTAFGARNETGMDNSATHDEALYEPATRTLSTLDVGLNCTLALDAEMLALIAAELGHHDEAKEFAALAASSAEKIRTELWDEARGIFANRQRAADRTGNDGFVRSLGPTSFYPLICGAASAEQAERLLAHLADPATFGGRYVIPNATRDDRAYADNVYWRGRIWPNVNWFVWHGLRRYGFDAEASAFAAQSVELFMQSWRERRMCGENYSAETGAIDDQPDTDPFCSWGAMLAMLGVAEVMDINPWTGWEIVNTGEDVELGPVASPVGAVTLRVADGRLSLAKGALGSGAGQVLFATDYVGRITQLTLAEGLACCTFPSGSDGPVAIELPQLAAARVVAVRLDGTEVAFTPAGDGIRIALPRLAAGARLSVHALPTTP
ncbi:MGH1-like glycoside hydrolase domain-containing protein [Methylobrevis albus]|uniref:Glycoside hydrolase family 37 n=1 Tax=Methylobrevis albus TaxID=2793297 RepID=A0A931MZ83_9HYPH|nr:trehalase family glycosidase [Methylobrevis albus]MBH0239212.1 glycoside hydrolase family 37 [Methylobrevis albus]